MRTTKADNEPSPEQDTVEAPTPAPTAVAEAAAEVPPSSSGEPYPGAGYFHGGRHSDIVAALGRRLEQEGCAPVGQRLGPDWTNAHRRAFAAWQHKLRPKEGGDVSGVPDEVAWDKLRVPRVSPLPKGD